MFSHLPIGPAYSWHLPNAVAYPDRHAIVISESMMKLTNSSLHGRMSPELETVVAHEFGHLKDGFVHLYGTRLQVFAMPLVAMAGLYLYDKAHAKTEHKHGQSKAEYLNNLTENLHKAADAEIAETKIDKKEYSWKTDPRWQEWLINAGRYSIAAAIGVAGGLAATHYGVKNLEYGADKMAVQLTGNPEIYKKVLSDMHAIFDEAGRGAVKKYKKPDTFGKIIKEKYHNILSEAMNAHPSLKERLDAINNFTKRLELEQNAGFSAARA